MSILVKKRKVEGMIATYYVGLWVGAQGLEIGITEDDEFGFDAGLMPLEDALAVGRKVRALAKWATTPEGRARVEALFQKEARIMSDPVPSESEGK